MSNWKHTLHLADTFRSDLSLDLKTEVIVNRIKRAAWYEGANSNGHLECVLEELTDAAEDEDVNWWDQAWAAFYDIADAERVWVKTL